VLQDCEGLHIGEPESFHSDTLGLTDDGAVHDRGLQVFNVLRSSERYRDVSSQVEAIIDPAYETGQGLDAAGWRSRWGRFFGFVSEQPAPWVPT